MEDLNIITEREERQKLERYFEVLLYYVVIFALIVSYLPIGVVVNHAIVNVMSMLAFFSGVIGYRLMPVESKGPIPYNFEIKSLVIGALDVLFTSVIIGATGGGYSPFILLYAFPIMTAALLLRPIHIFIEMGLFLLSVIVLPAILLPGFLTYRFISFVILISMSYLLTLVLVADRQKRAKSLAETQLKLADINKALADQIGSVQDKNKYLEDVKSATLNILEDLEGEKNKVIISAQEALKFKQATEASTDGVVIISPSEIIEYVNPAWTRLTEYTFDESVSNKINFIQSKKIPQKVVDSFHQAIVQGDVFISEELTHVRKDGSEFEVRVSLYPILENGKPIFFVKTLQDITERKSLDRQKSEFISIASHQLRTPLSAMNWFLEMLSDEEVGKINDKQKDYLDQVSQSNKRLIILVNDLLNVSRLEGGRISFEMSKFDSVEMINGLIKEVNPLAEAKNLKFVVNVAKDLPQITSDQSKLRQVVANFISNAIKYTKGKSEIIINLEKAGESVKITVTDQGVGIPRAQQVNVFGKFFRGDNVVKLQTEGTGLGLYIAKITIESLGGTIGFTSVEDKGSSFWVSVPIEQIPAKEEMK